MEETSVRWARNYAIAAPFGCFFLARPVSFAPFDAPSFGEVAEWSNAPDSKSGLRFYRNVGSNPTLSAASARLPDLAREVTDAALDANALGPRVLSNEEWSSLGRFTVTLRPADIGAFRTPSLRNVDRTAPYMHDGSIKTLSDAIDHEIYYRSFSTGHSANITSSERHALLVFLQSLSDRS